MNDDKEKAAGVVQTPGAANMTRKIESSASVSAFPVKAKPDVLVRPGEECLALAAAWSALRARYPATRRLRSGMVVLPTNERPCRYELMGDLSVRLVDPRTGEVVARSAGLLGARTP